MWGSFRPMLSPFALLLLLPAYKLILDLHFTPSQVPPAATATSHQPPEKQPSAVEGLAHFGVLPSHSFIRLLATPLKRQLPQRSVYFKWIKSDVSYWEQQGGITQEMLERGSRTCCPMRFQIVAGRLFVEHRDPGKEGFYPASRGREWATAQARIPYAILALMELLQTFPGMMPDVDALFFPGDFPVFRKPLRNSSVAPAPPAFGYNSAPGFADIPFPDYSFYGHEVHILDDDQGRPLWGWDNQLDFLAAKQQEQLAKRLPQIVWRGRTDGQRYQLRRDFIACPRVLNSSGDPAAAQLFNVHPNQGSLDLRSICTFRFQAYLEGKAWSTNLKQKLACGSVVLAPKLEFYEFWTRGLETGRHYLEVTPGAGMCHDVATKVQALNAYLDQAQPRPNATLLSSNKQDLAMAAQTRRLHEQRTPKLEGLRADQQHQHDEEQHHQQEEQQQQHQYPWGKSSPPQQIADEGRRFLQDHLRMEDVRQYLLDVLREYAALQQFRPQPSRGAVCYTGRRLLQLFGIPYREAGDDVAQRYPWLADWDPGCPKESQ